MKYKSVKFINIWRRCEQEFGAYFLGHPVGLFSDRVGIPYSL